MPYSGQMPLRGAAFLLLRAILLRPCRFVGVLRHSYWEEGRPLPRMGGSHMGMAEAAAAVPEGGQERPPASRMALGQQQGQWGQQAQGGVPPSPDLDCCLLHQKLQMLQLCIHR